MSDMMNRGMGAPPGGGMGNAPGGGMGGGQNPIEANRSLLNPTDVAAMQQNTPPPKTVGDAFNILMQKMGLQPGDPVEKLGEALKKQSQNASPMGKMMNMAGGASGAPQRPAPQRTQAPPQGGQGLDALMG